MAIILTDPFVNLEPETQLTSAFFSKVVPGGRIGASTVGNRPVITLLRGKSVLQERRGTGSQVSYAGLSAFSTPGAGKVWIHFSLENAASPGDHQDSAMLLGLNNVDMGSALSNATARRDKLLTTASGGLRFNEVSSGPGLLSETGENSLTLALDFTAGSIEVFLDNDTVPVLPSTHTMSSLSAVSFGGRYSNLSAGWCFYNIVVYDDTGDENNDYLGPLIVERLPLLGSAHSSFTPEGAATNFDAIDKRDFDEDSYNVSPETNGEYDSFTVDPASVDPGSEILAVSLDALLSKTNTSPRGAELIATDGSAFDAKPGAVVVGAFGPSGNGVFETALDGTEWDAAKLGATQFGYRVTE